ncbi:MAG: AI-2E family transporter [Bacillota bacterium]
MPIGFLTDRRRIVRALSRALIVFGAAYFIYRVRKILPPFAIAWFISFMLEPAVSWLEGRKIPRARSILLVYAVLLVALSVVLLYFVPRFVRDIKVLAGEIPRIISTVKTYRTRIQGIAAQHNLPGGLDRGLVSLLEWLEGFLDRIGDNLIPYFASSAAFISYLVISPVIAYYILRDMNRWRQRALVFLAQYPMPYVDLVRDIDKVVSGFVRGQTLVALIVWAMVWVATAILGVKYGVVLGMVSGLGEFVPFFGAVIGSIPVLLAALAKSTMTMVWALGLIVFIQWLDANLIVPKVTASRVGLHPLWVMFSMLAGAELFGFWGILLAVPAAGVMGAFYKFLRAILGNHGKDSLALPKNEKP